MKPEILAPAGDIASFLAAMSAGADAVYVGLKHFSARMQADNFSTSDLSRMVGLARDENRKVYVAFNSLLKPDDTDAAYRLCARLERDVKPHALIVQDLGMLDLARQAGFSGELHLSTLANVTCAQAVASAHALGVQRVILPRELSIDEVKMVAESCPEDMNLELFVHGALCYCVSGRCYWSSFLGGKSGLRGRCVQPCRRAYQQRSNSGRYFSSLDLSLDVLARTLLDVPHLASWKIEGRKKGPHYVYHVTTAYRMLRDFPDDAQAKKDAATLLEMALGRPGTHARFLPQHDAPITAPNDQTSSGRFIGGISFSPNAINKTEKDIVLKPRFALQAGDFLRIGQEDEPWHSTLPVQRAVPKGGTLTLNLSQHKTPKAGTPVLLIDRRDPEMAQELARWGQRFARYKAHTGGEITTSPTLPRPVPGKRKPDMLLHSFVPLGRDSKPPRNTMTSLWLSPKAVQSMSRTLYGRTAWWLPPVIWPEEEASWAKLIRQVARDGGTTFVCNTPWQSALFEPNSAELIAGPFCNPSNAACLGVLKGMGFRAAIISPELAADEILALPRQSCLPLGIVLSGLWPVGIARHKLSGLKANEPFQSPKGEKFWARNYGQNLWIYPAWPLDITEKRPELEQAGYSFFVQFKDSLPKTVPEPQRTSQFNWDIGLM